MNIILPGAYVICNQNHNNIIIIIIIIIIAYLSFIGSVEESWVVLDLNDQLLLVFVRPVHEHSTNTCHVTFKYVYSCLTLAVCYIGGAAMVTWVIY